MATEPGLGWLSLGGCLEHEQGVYFSPRCVAGRIQPARPAHLAWPGHACPARQAQRGSAWLSPGPAYGSWPRPCGRGTFPSGKVDAFRALEHGACALQIRGPRRSPALGSKLAKPCAPGQLGQLGWVSWLACPAGLSSWAVQVGQLGQLDWVSWASLSSLA